jgi:hypothetical protein
MSMAGKELGSEQARWWLVVQKFTRELRSGMHRDGLDLNADRASLVGGEGDVDQLAMRGMCNRNQQEAALLIAQRIAS